MQTWRLFFCVKNMEKNVAYSLLTVKKVDTDKRMFSGMATTPEPDRVGDVVEPMGVQFKNPLPLLWMHDHLLPVGTVEFGKPTKDGVPFTATLPNVAEPSQLKARIDEAWQSVKAGIVRAVSIGFRPLEYSVIEETGGLRFTRTDVFELSLVTVPANASATITSVKSLDQAVRKAALGNERKQTEIKATSSGASEKNLVKTVSIAPKGGQNIMKLSEKLKGFRDELEVKKKRMVALAEKSAEEGITFDAAEQEEFDTLDGEVKTLEKHIASLEKAVSHAGTVATPVAEKAGQDEKAAAEVRGANIQVKHQKLDKGIEFARYAMCVAAAKGDPRTALELAKTHYGNHDRVINALDFQAKGNKFEQVMKADVAAGTTLNSTWAAPLVQYQDFAGDFVDFLRPRTIIGQFGNGGVPSLNSIPFNVRIPAQTSGGAAYWVGEGAPKPLTKFDFDDVELRWAKVATIAVLTEELIRFSNPSAERLVRDSLAAAVIERIDLDFINPAKAASTNVSPASITNGANNVASVGGTDAETVRCDLQALWAFFIAANNAPRNAVYIMNSTVALALSLMQNPLGQSEYPGITMNGGTLMGVPVIVSDYVPAGVVVLVNASDIWLADDGQVTLDVSREASLQMLDNPTNNSATPTATTMVSMFQTNSVALRAERYINWARRRPSGVAYLTGVAWGACAIS